MISKFLISIVISLVIFFGIALGLIVSQSLQKQLPKGGLDFAKALESRFEAPQNDPSFTRERFEAEDGQSLQFTRVAAPGSEALPLLVMVHGSGWHGQQFDRLAWRLRDVAEVRAVTLRGHGASPARRGDVDYIGQFEDDLAALIGTQPEERRVIMLGHSSGGGLVVRFAGGPRGGMIDGAILLAPFLKYNAPVTRENSGGWAYPLTRRIIGLSMLNMVGIHALDGLTVIQFAMPEAVLNGPLGHTATTAYSWRLNQSFAPRSDYMRDVAALPPFLLVAGLEDEAFDARGYAPLMQRATAAGRYRVVPGANHLGVVDAPETEALIREYLGEF